MATATTPKGGTDLWDSSVKFVTGHITEFIVMLIIFIVISFVIDAIFGAIALGASGAVTLGYGAYGYAPHISGIYSIIAAVGGAVGAFITLWFIASLYELVGVIGAGSVDYVKTVQNGLNRTFANTNLLVIVVAIGFVAELFNSMWALLGIGIGSAIAFAVIAGVFTAAYVGIALSGMTKRSEINFLNVFSDVNGRSSTAGIFLYITVGIAIIPILNILQFLLVPLAVTILAGSSQSGSAPAQKPKQAAAGK